MTRKRKNIGFLAPKDGWLGVQDIADSLSRTDREVSEGLALFILRNSQNGYLENNSLKIHAVKQRYPGDVSRRGSTKECATDTRAQDGNLGRVLAYLKDDVAGGRLSPSRTAVSSKVAKDFLNTGILGKHGYRYLYWLRKEDGELQDVPAASPKTPQQRSLWDEVKADPVVDVVDVRPTKPKRKRRRKAKEEVPVTPKKSLTVGRFLFYLCLFLMASFGVGLIITLDAYRDLKTHCAVER